MTAPDAAGAGGASPAAGTVGWVDGADFDTCKERSALKVAAALTEGRDTRWVQLVGLLEPAPCADPRWLEMPQRYWQHYVAVIDGQVHDLAPRQFWPEEPAVLVCDEDTYLSRWSSSVDVTGALEVYLGSLR